MQIVLREWNALLRFHFWLISHGVMRLTPISHPLHGGVYVMPTNINDPPCTFRDDRRHGNDRYVMIRILPHHQSVSTGFLRASLGVPAVVWKVVSSREWNTFFHLHADESALPFGYTPN